MILPPDHPLYDAILEADPDDWPCARCGQRAIVNEATDCAELHVCATCRDLEHAPQGEAIRLFTPAPNQIPGQLGF